MTGGMMEGYWATGRPARDTTPRITVRTAMTMATIGRSMKKRVIGPLARRARPPEPCFAVTGVPGRRYCSPVTITFSPAFRPFVDHPEVAHARPRLDGADLRLAVGAHHRDTRCLPAARSPRAGGRGARPASRPARPRTLAYCPGRRMLWGLGKKPRRSGCPSSRPPRRSASTAFPGGGRRCRPRGSARGTGPRSVVA